MSDTGQDAVRVLIAEDEKLDFDIVVRALSGMFGQALEHEWVQSRTELRERLKRDEPIDLLIADLGLPLDPAATVEILREIRQGDFPNVQRKLPIVAVSITPTPVNRNALDPLDVPLIARDRYFDVEEFTQAVKHVLG